MDMPWAFQNLCVAEVESRGRQAGVLEDLVPQVEEAKRRYQEEKTRRDSLVAWWERETARQESRALASAGGVFIELWDPKPSETPIVPRPLHVAHTCTARSRAASIGGGTEKSRLIRHGCKTLFRRHAHRTCFCMKSFPGYVVLGRDLPVRVRGCPSITAPSLQGLNSISMKTMLTQTG